ncbi:hypothetical protein Mtc_0712 [Methanocella conradii HZ254]|uniref:Uncharacterized protein n=1 Tax=Methanocella conradii (strain DSM 24694 / JCM 17849 / CGMCC 1.5162 / HZ254) TaxID=1041930 RepID=H8I8K0_METCZ|nr:hypothetical protein Mtc_0712 [Methanocella conradii HZ254]
MGVVKLFSRLGALGGVSTGYREEESLDHHRISHDKPIARVPNLAITIVAQIQVGHCFVVSF